ncbi:putative lim domain-containing protein [Erysiphe neolycopersici]|uniref:Putative lim domain-containing protein n=1 Tax=Erysiphe neolycopersici TaxID=212602 RepID=A0A420HQQ3_9PEZI|nr:putative lim domain-containing protein [Erysiphe neolycopersici]
MENTRSSSLLPTIKCSNCAADIQISLITDHVCSVNGYLTPADYNPISNMMLSEMQPGATFFQTEPQTPSSILSSPASPGRLPFSQKTKSYSNSLSESLTPPEFLSPNKDPTISGFPTPKDIILRLKSVEDNQRARSKNQESTSSNPESNQISAVAYPKNIANSGFFQRVDKISPGPFDINGKRDLFNNIEYNVYRKTSLGNLSDTRTGKASSDKADVQPPSARSHFYKNSGGSISSKTNYAILPKVPRKNGYDGFGPPNSHNNGTTKLISSSDPQNSPLKLETKLKSLIDDAVSKVETQDFFESIFDPVSTLSQGFNGRKKDNLPPILPRDITDGLSLSPQKNHETSSLLPPKNKVNKIPPKKLQENIDVMPSSLTIKKLDKSPLVLPKIRSNELPPIPPLSPLPPKENINRQPSSLPQKSSIKSPLLLPKIKLDKLPPLPPLSPLPPKENNIKLSPLFPQKNLTKPSLLLPKIKMNKLPPLQRLKTLKENIDERPPLPLQNNPDNLPSQLQLNKLVPLPPKESYDELPSFPVQQNIEKNYQGNHIEENTQFLSSEMLNKSDDFSENPVYSLSNSNSLLKHNRKRSDVSQLENLMADIESSMSDLDLNERPSTRSSSSSSTHISIPSTYKSVNVTNNSPQISNVLSSPLAPIGIPQISNSLKNSNNKPIFSKQNSLPIYPTAVSPVDRAAQSELPSNRSPTSQTRSPSDKLRLSKGICKGCGENIYGKSVSSADGRLTGRYHKECFVCKICKKPFKTASCYVINDAPYCEAHYHRINGSNCSTCKKGIEGKYIETDRGQKHHPDCLTCSDCKCVLQNNYFEMSGLLYCERDAYQRAKQKSYLNSNIDGKGIQMEHRSKSLVMT